MIMATVKASPAVLLTSALTLFLFACTQPSASPLDSPVLSQVATESNTTPSKSHEQEVDALLASPSANIPGVLIFVSDLFSKPGIGALDLRDRTIRMLTSGSIDADPSLSSDGRKIVFISTRNRDPYYDIYIMNIDGSDQNPIRSANDLSIRSNFSPVLSPDGQYVVFHSDRDLNGNMDIYIADISSGNSKRIINHPAMDIYPSWSPDGRRIIFSSDRDGDYDLYTINIDGSDLRKVFVHPEYSDIFPRYSPNGQYIVFTTQFYLDSTDSHIALIRSDGSGYRQITQGKGQYQHATWVGNRTLVFSGRSNIYEKWRVYISSLENFNPVQLTSQDANFYNPSLIITR